MRKLKNNILIVLFKDEKSENLVKHWAIIFCFVLVIT